MNNVTYYKNGLRQKYNGDETCGSLKYADIIQNFDTMLSLDDDKQKSEDYISYYNINDLKDILKPMSNSGDIDSVQEYTYVTYFWSNFAFRDKSKERRFEEFQEKLQTIDQNIKIIRINCDFSTNKYNNFNLKFKKEKNTDYHTLIIDEKS